MRCKVRRTEVLAEGAAIVRLAATDAFAADFSVREGSILRVSITPAIADFYVLSPSSGSAVGLKSAQVIAAGESHVQDVVLDGDRTWNIQAVTTGIAADIKVLQYVF